MYNIENIQNFYAVFPQIFFKKISVKKLHKNSEYFLCYTCLSNFYNVLLATIAKNFEKYSIGHNF